MLCIHLSRIIRTCLDILPAAVPEARLSCPAHLRVILLLQEIWLCMGGKSKRVCLLPIRASQVLSAESSICESLTNTQKVWHHCYSAMLLQASQANTLPKAISIEQHSDDILHKARANPIALYRCHAAMLLHARLTGLVRKLICAVCLCRQTLRRRPPQNPCPPPQQHPQSSHAWVRQTGHTVPLVTR